MSTITFIFLSIGLLFFTFHPYIIGIIMYFSCNSMEITVDKKNYKLRFLYQIKTRYSYGDWKVDVQDLETKKHIGDIEIPDDYITDRIVEDYATERIKSLVEKEERRIKRERSMEYYFKRR